MDEEESKVWVVRWEYHDKSGSGLIQAFDSEDAASKLHETLCKYGGDGRAYYCDPVPFTAEF